MILLVEGKSQRFGSQDNSSISINDIRISKYTISPVLNDSESLVISDIGKTETQLEYFNQFILRTSP